MPNTPRPDEDLLRRQAQVAALAGLVRGSTPDELVAAVVPADVPGWFTPDLAVLELAVTALEFAAPVGEPPLEYEGLRERHLSEIAFVGRIEHRNSQYALYAAGCLRGGLRPDLLNDAGWWNSRLWIYAVYALLIYSRVAAERQGVGLDRIAREIAARRSLGDEVEHLLAGHEPRQRS